MFIQNKYLSWYNSIVSRARDRHLDSTTYIEVHHIIPKKCGGSDEPHNLVKLTAKEHFVCHLLLPKIVESKHRKAMIYAFWRMSNSTGKRYKPSSRIYEISKKLFIESQTGHPNYLKYQTEVSKDRISRTMKSKLSMLSDEERSNRIKNSCSSPQSWTEDRKRKISNALLGITRSKETREKISIASKNRTAEQKKSCGDSNRGKTWRLIEGKRVWFPKEN